MRFGSCLVAEKRKEKGGIKTKPKLLAGIIVTLLLATTLFYAIPIEAFTEPPIKIGIMGPLYWIQGQGMVEGAQLAAARKNGLGGMAGHEVVIVSQTTHPDAGTEPTGPSGAAAMSALMDQDVDFVIGGFRSEAVFAAREVAMDNQIIYTICGAATNELIDCGGAGCGACVRCNYERYKYLFRNSPPNSTTLFYEMAGFLKYAMAAKLMPLYTGYVVPLKIAVVSEAAVWADVIHTYMSMEYFWNTIMGMSAYGGVEVAYQTRCDPVNVGWIPGTVAAIDASGARLIIETISGPSGRAFINAWGTTQPKAAMAGIDVPGQEIALHWTATGGLCETETFLATAGGADDREGGTPMNEVGPVTTKDFYRDYYDTYGHAPIYTSYCAYDTIMGLNDAVDEWVALYGDFGPGQIKDDPDYDKLIPIIEQTIRYGLTSTFKYTGPNPGNNGDFTDYDPDTAGDQPYPYGEPPNPENPTMMGTLHELYSPDLGPTWPAPEYGRSMLASWQAARLEVVYPVDQPYSKIWALPKWMIPAQYHTDINQDGVRNVLDTSVVSFALASTPGDSWWQFVADYDGNGVVNGTDLDPVSTDFGKAIERPYP